MYPLFSTIVAATEIRLEFIWENRGLFFDGVQLTLLISLIAFTLSTALGLVVALARMSNSRIVRPLVAGYVNIFRAIPLLVFILFVYYGIAISFELQISAIQAGILALTLQYSAWLGEIFRGGIQAVPHGQREAALSVGMSRAQTFTRVVLPQAARIVIPPTGNMAIGMIKDSSLVYLIGVPELLRVSNRLANRTFRYFEVYLATVFIYLILTTAVYFGVKYLERRFALVDLLTAQARRWSPMARRRTARLRSLQDAVRAASGADAMSVATTDDDNSAKDVPGPDGSGSTQREGSTESAQI